MNIDLLDRRDISELERIHDKFYEFKFPLYDPSRKLLEKFIITHEGHIITFGALELSIEAVVITNQDMDAKLRREGLYKLLECLKYNAKKNDFNSIHCLVEGNNWIRHLQQAGFKECAGKYLYFPLEDK